MSSVLELVIGWYVQEKPSQSVSIYAVHYKLTFTNGLGVRIGLQIQSLYLGAMRSICETTVTLVKCR